MQTFHVKHEDLRQAVLPPLLLPLPPPPPTLPNTRSATGVVVVFSRL